MKPIVVLCKLCGKIKRFGEYHPIPPTLQLSILEGDVEVNYQLCDKCGGKNEKS